MKSADMKCRKADRVRLGRVSAALEKYSDKILVKIMPSEVTQKSTSKLGLLLKEEADDVFGSVDMLLNEGFAGFATST